jgi:hypothetical protein
MPDIRRSSLGPLFYAWGGAFGLAILLGVGLLFWFPGHSEPRVQTAPRLLTEEERLCERFARLKNAADPAADALLPPKPAWPEKPIDQEEADRLQADLFLRSVLRIESIRPEPGPAGTQRFALTTEGNVAAPALSVRTTDVKGDSRVERSQRTMSNPELIIEVRGGILHALRARLAS